MFHILNAQMLGIEFYKKHGRKGITEIEITSIALIIVWFCFKIGFGIFWRMELISFFSP